MNSHQLFLWIFILLFFLACDDHIDVNTIQELPKFAIDTEPSIPIKDKVAMELKVIEGDNSKTHTGSIQRRGGYSISYPKHSYEIDLLADVSLVNLNHDDDWILNANFIDKTFLRHVISYEIFREMSPNNRSANTAYLELDVNNIDQGLYVLMEKLDRSSLGVNKLDPQAFIFKEPHIFRSSYDNITPEDPNNFHQQTFPKIEEVDQSHFIEEFREVILNSDDEIFEEKVEELIDIENIMDWHLLLLISNNSDGILKNYYLYKIDEFTPMRVAPWDYDHSFGRDGDNELNVDERPLDIHRSILFSRLLTFDWYQDRLQQRWKALQNANIISEQSLKQRIYDKANMIRPHVERNSKIWPDDDPIYYDANDFDQEIDIMIEFLRVRFIRLRAYFDE